MQTEVATKTCQACAYWNSSNSNEGECRRRAPQTIAFEVNDHVSVESRFPTTSSNDWCGDFEAQ
ncbi:MAG: hypothetical protein AAGC74_04915 [Verrucomicrobiota bacterium]